MSTIGEDLEIAHNEKLINVSGLDNLNYINGDIIIRDNDTLVDLSGIEDIIADSIDDLRILDNNYLSICNVESICKYLESPNGIVEIYNNAPGCNSQIEVKTECEVGIPDIFNEPQISIYPNPAKERIYISTKQDKVIVEVSVFNHLGQLVKNNKGKNSINISTIQKGMYIIEVVGEGWMNRKKLIIE